MSGNVTIDIESYNRLCEDSRKYKKELKDSVLKQCKIEGDEFNKFYNSYMAFHRHPLPLSNFIPTASEIIEFYRMRAEYSEKCERSTLKLLDIKDEITRELLKRSLFERIINRRFE